MRAMKSHSMLSLVLAWVCFSTGCSSPQSGRPQQAADFALSRYATYELAPLRRADGQPVREEIRAAIEGSLHRALAGRGLRPATNTPADLTVLTQGGVLPRTSAYGQRYTASTGIPVVRGRSFDIDDQNDASVQVTLIDRRTQQAVWQNSWSRSFVNRHPTPDEARQAMDQVLAPLAGGQ